MTDSQLLDAVNKKTLYFSIVVRADDKSDLDGEVIADAQKVINFIHENTELKVECIA